VPRHNHIPISAYVKPGRNQAGLVTDPLVALLVTIPGIGEPLALTIAAEIGEITATARPIERGPYEDATFWTPSWVALNGAVTTTLVDMGKWAAALGTGSLVASLG
jgi:hypothetical protein